MSTFVQARSARGASSAAGFSYVSVLLAIVLLALCAAPAADAIRNAGAAPAAGARQLADLLCLKSSMETVGAEPYQNLSLAAAGPATRSAYSLAADGACPQRNVYIARVSVDADGNASYPAADTGLLQLVVALADDAAPGAPATMSLATMVLR